MKKYTYILIATLIAGATTVFAEEGCPSCSKGKGGDKGAEIFKRLDADGDGQISAAEFKAGQEAMRAKLGERGGRKGGRGPRMSPEKRQEILQKFDADGDGQLSEAEREAMHAAARAKHAEILQKFDADGDGRLNEAEREAAHAARMAEQESSVE